MSISSLFELLGAPLANNRWSWGSERASDGAIFLRVWQDLKFIDETGLHMLVAGNFNEETESLGALERLKHIELIRSGAPCFMVMCVAQDVEIPKRTIKEFGEKELFVGGDLVETARDFLLPPSSSERTRFLARDGAIWIRVASRKPVSSIAP